jgi:hypothetical protein
MPSMSRPILWLCLLLCAGCAGPQLSAVPTALAPAPSTAEPLPGADRLLVRTAQLRVVVEDPVPLTPGVGRLVHDMGGYVETSTAEPRRVAFAVRVPGPQLDPFLDSVAGWGDPRERRVATADVTDQTIDMEARLRNLVAVRDRLRALLHRAAQVTDVIAVERELARVQAEVESLEVRLARLRTDVGYSRVDLVLEQRTVLGPVGWLVTGAARLVARLFVVR